ncbi:Bpu10I family restriction endonuclease [Pseudomonas sp. MRSN 12121]|uniref:Bpu10I family restriction endonuclease n=1 Tax=Pseudomonas sp. MRSN 12121 TaxID=1611770 RepID=UPI000A8F81EF|nr:Bpu10I family restriction endonuclease [Pseudomonas sp. MRSN 12121]
MKVSHPETHGSKLKALAQNSSLPNGDRQRVLDAIEKYEEWRSALSEMSGEGKDLLGRLVALLNDYKNSIDLDLIFGSKNDFLYRQNGQLKLSNSILEEFLPYVFDERMVPGFKRLSNVICGPQSSFAGLSFGSPFLDLDAGGVFLKNKDQDFSVAKTHRITISDFPVTEKSFTAKFCVSHFATEIKTNLDKTMFQEASQTANELKRAVPGSKYILLCEYLDMTPITTKLTSIDEVVVLRKAKRLASNVRKAFSTHEGRQSSKSAYTKFVLDNPIHVSSFERFLAHLDECFPEAGDDTVDTVLERGYF